jgi:hypothetical protein
MANSHPPPRAYPETAAISYKFNMRMISLNQENQKLTGFDNFPRSAQLANKF